MHDDFITFTLDEDACALFHDDRVAFYHELISSMESALKANYWFFRWDCDESREEIVEDSISIHDIEVTEEGDGTASYSVDGHVHWGCRDIDGDIDHHDQFKFSYSVNSGEVTIPFREEHERDCDDI